MSMSAQCDQLTARARVLRAAARLHRTNMLLCANWVDRLCEQLSAEWLEDKARHLEAAVYAYELDKLVLLARGAVLAPAA